MPYTYDMDIESSPRPSDAADTAAVRDERLANSVKTVLAPLHANINPEDDPDTSHVFERDIPNVHTDMEVTGAPLVDPANDDTPLPDAVAYHEDVIKKYAAKKHGTSAAIYLAYIVGVLVLINVAVIGISKFLVH